MSDSAYPWTASVVVHATGPDVAAWLERSLGPEASREVPRARAEVALTPEGALELRISARDSGSMRAALNTYLGWIHLSLATARAAGRSD
jgi:tRNA threonylcarbamoyladenosine modification (KEOPS) complex  Pcc1 subunit